MLERVHGSVRRLSKILNCAIKYDYIIIIIIVVVVVVIIVDVVIIIISSYGLFTNF